MVRQQASVQYLHRVHVYSSWKKDIQPVYQVWHEGKVEQVFWRWAGGDAPQTTLHFNRFIDLVVRESRAVIGDISNGCTVNTDVNFNLSLLHFNIADIRWNSVLPVNLWSDNEGWISVQYVYSNHTIIILCQFCLSTNWFTLP